MRQLRHEMDYHELAHWFAFFDIHGYPDQRQEFYGAQLASLILSVVSKRGQEYKTGDFMLDEILETEDDRAKKAELELRAHLDALVAQQEKSDGK